MVVGLVLCGRGWAELDLRTRTRFCITVTVVISSCLYRELLVVGIINLLLRYTSPMGSLFFDVDIFDLH